MAAGAQEIEDSVSALSAVLSAAGITLPAPASDLAALGEIDAALAPLRLPAQVRRFWELVDPESVRVGAFPALTSPGFALETWWDHVRETPGMVPRVLFPVCYESQCFLMVELDGPDAEDGGAIFAWGYGGYEFRLVFGDLAAFLGHLVSGVREGRYERQNDYLFIEGELLERAPAPVSHPVLGAVETIGEAAMDWPELWRARSGLAADRTQPLGAELTIAEVLERSRRGEVAGRVHATVSELATGAEGMRATVSDGTASMRVWVPAAATALGPVIGGRFEFHVVAPARGVPDSPDLSALGSDPHRASLEHALRGVDAVVTDLRPAAG